jgi:outer membrane protein
MRQLLGFCTCVIVPVTVLFWTGSAAAQTVTKLEPPIAPPQQASEYRGEPAGWDDESDGDHITIGVGGMYQPAYMGSRKYEFQPIAAVDIKRGNFFLNFEDGIGFTPIDNETVTVGASVVPVFDGYDAEDVPNRFNKIELGAGARGFVSVRQFGFEATAGVTQIFAVSTKGLIADFDLSRPIMVNERLFITPSIGTTWGNARHNNRFYGVNALQAEESGLRQFRPGAGFMEAEAELGLQYQLTDHIGFGVSGGVTTLLGNVKDSPIVRKKTAPFGMAFVAYTF